MFSFIALTRANLQTSSRNVKKRIGYRIFLVVGDEVSPLSKTTFDEFFFRRQAVLREFAGKTIDIATVVCRMENTKPREIVRIYCQRFRVKGDGSIDEGHSPKSGRPATLPGQRTLRGKNGEHPGGAANTDADLHRQRLVQTLTMISGAAQKKILDVLRR